MDRNSPPPPLSPSPLPTRGHVLSLLKETVLEIQSTDRQLTDLVIPQDIYDLCRRYVEELPFKERYGNHKVFEILEEDSKELHVNEVEVNKMKNGLKSLLRYPLNLLVAPNRPELKIIKASTSFFMFQVKRNLKDAHSFLSLMGYDQVRNATDLSLSKSFSIERVYTLVLDIVILHEELETISFLISKGMPSDVKFHHYFIARRYGPSNKWDCLDFIMDGEAARLAYSPLQHSPYPSDTGHREDSTGQNYYNTSSNDDRGYSDQRYDKNDRYYEDSRRCTDSGYHTSLYHEDKQRASSHYYGGQYYNPSSNYYGNESGQYHRNQYDRDQYHQNQHDQDQYHRNQHDQDQYHRNQHDRDQYPYQDDRYSRGQHYYDDDQQRYTYNKDKIWHQEEDQEPSRRREVECDGGQSVNDVSTSQSYADTIICTSPLDSVGGNMPPPIFSAGQMKEMFKSSTPQRGVSDDENQPHSLGYPPSKSNSFDGPRGINSGRRYSSTPSFSSDTSYTDNMYRVTNDPIPQVFSPSDSVTFTIDEETGSERNEDEIRSRSPPHVNASAIKPRRNAPSVAAGSANLPKTWSGSDADREEIKRQMSKDDSFVNYWTCTFCSNENYGGKVCEACNQERAIYSLHSY